MSRNLRLIDRGRNRPVGDAPLPLRRFGRVGSETLLKGGEGGLAFGGAIRVPGAPYVDFLIPGIFTQAVAFGAMSTAVGLFADPRTGLLERFRTLPMARSAVLTGRTLADLVRNIFDAGGAGPGGAA